MTVWMVSSRGAVGAWGWVLFKTESTALEFAEKMADKHGLRQVSSHSWSGNGWIIHQEVREEPVRESL